jgi:hypothetical protein
MTFRDTAQWMIQIGAHNPQLMSVSVPCTRCAVADNDIVLGGG